MISVEKANNVRSCSCLSCGESIKDNTDIEILTVRVKTGDGDSGGLCIDLCDDCLEGFRLLISRPITKQKKFIKKCINVPIAGHNMDKKGNVNNENY